MFTDHLVVVRPALFVVGGLVVGLALLVVLGAALLLVGGVVLGLVVGLAFLGIKEKLERKIPMGCFVF